MIDLQSPLAIGTTVPQSLRLTMALSALSSNVTNELNYDLSKETWFSEKALSFPLITTDEVHIISEQTKLKYNEENTIM